MNTVPVTSAAPASPKRRVLLRVAALAIFCLTFLALYYSTALPQILLGAAWVIILCCGCGLSAAFWVASLSNNETRAPQSWLSQPAHATGDDDNTAQTAQSQA